VQQRLVERGEHLRPRLRAGRLGAPRSTSTAAVISSSGTLRMAMRCHSEIAPQPTRASFTLSGMPFPLWTRVPRQFSIRTGKRSK